MSGWNGANICTFGFATLIRSTGGFAGECTCSDEKKNGRNAMYHPIIPELASAVEGLEIHQSKRVLSSHTTVQINAKKGKLICRYILRNEVCPNGDNCHFNHGANVAEVSDEIDRRIADKTLGDFIYDCLDQIYTILTDRFDSIQQVLTRWENSESWRVSQSAYFENIITGLRRHSLTDKDNEKLLRFYAFLRKIAKDQPNFSETFSIFPEEDSIEEKMLDDLLRRSGKHMCAKESKRIETYWIKVDGLIHSNFMIPKDSLCAYGSNCMCRHPDNAIDLLPFLTGSSIDTEKGKQRFSSLAEHQLRVNSQEYIDMDRLRQEKKSLYDENARKYVALKELVDLSKRLVIRSQASDGTVTKRPETDAAYFARCKQPDETPVAFAIRTNLQKSNLETIRQLLDLISKDGEDSLSKLHYGLYIHKPFAFCLVRDGGFLYTPYHEASEEIVSVPDTSLTTVINSSANSLDEDFANHQKKANEKEAKRLKLKLERKKRYDDPYERVIRELRRKICVQKYFSFSRARIICVDRNAWLDKMLVQRISTVLQQYKNGILHRNKSAARLKRKKEKLEKEAREKLEALPVFNFSECLNELKGKLKHIQTTCTFTCIERDQSAVDQAQYRFNQALIAMRKLHPKMRVAEKMHVITPSYKIEITKRSHYRFTKALNAMTILHPKMIEMHTITPRKKSSKKSSKKKVLTRVVSRLDFLKKSADDEFSESDIGSGDECEFGSDDEFSEDGNTSDHDKSTPPSASSQRRAPSHQGTFSNQQSDSDSDDDESNQSRAPSSPQRNSPSNQQAKKNGFSMEELRQRKNDARRSDVKLTPAQKKARIEEQKREEVRLRLEKEEAEQTIKDNLSNLQAEYERAREIYTNTKSSSDEEVMNVARLKYNALKKYLDEALAKQNTKRKSKGKGSLNAGVKNATDKEEAKQAERQIKKDRNTRFNNLIDTCAKIVV